MKISVSHFYVVKIGQFLHIEKGLSHNTFDVNIKKDRLYLAVSEATMA
jgi:hypothetical protein